MTALEFILLKQLDLFLTNLNTGAAQLLTGLITEFIHLANVLITFADSILPPYA